MSKRQTLNGKWEVRVYDRNSPGRQRYVGTFDTEAEAAVADEGEHTSLIPSRTRTVGEWIDTWLDAYSRPAPATRRTYNAALKQVRRDAGAKRLAQIDRPTARALANKWPKSVTAVARTLFADAWRDGLTRENPFANLRLEQSRGRKDLDALTEPEIVALADSALECLGEYGPEFRALIIFAAYVGCRPGELCCLRRDDVDTERGEVTIRYSLDGEGGEKLPKNGKPRVVVVPPPALEALREVPVRLYSPYLFHSARGKRLSKGTLSYAFRVVRAQWAGRPKLELYALRHACATLLMERGLPPHVVAQQLGHTDGGHLVQVLYGHPRERGMRDQIKIAFGTWGLPTNASGEKAGNRRVS